MRNFRFVIFTLILISFTYTGPLQAQVSDSVLLHELIIHGSRGGLFVTGKNILELDSLKMAFSEHRNIGDVLSGSSSIFIKSYGAGSSSTLTSRGTEARHSSVLWNGFNLNSVSLGLADLSIIPVHAAENISVIHGGSASINGNSSIGSTILLNRKKPVFKDGTHLQTGFESGCFGIYNGSLNLQFTNKFFESRTSAFYNQAENNFKYINIAHRDKPESKLQHAAYNNYGIVQDFDFKIRSNQFLSASAWYQVTHREIPAMMTVPSSEAEQKDSVLRIYAGYKIVYAKSVIKVNGGYFDEFQNYSDPDFNIYKNYTIKNIFGDAEWRWFAGRKVILSTGVSYNQAMASFAEYKSAKRRELFAIYFASIYQIAPGWETNLNVRREISNTSNPPFTPSLGVEGNLYRKLVILKLNAGRHFSIPSMNDLYWNPGGNPNLLPEDALSAEGGLLFFKKHKQIPEISITAFHSVVDNWIKWSPGPGGIYTPQNISEVKTKGVETSLNFKRKLGELTTSIHINYTWCRSVISKTDEPYSEQLIGKQVMHVPEHVAGLSASIDFRSYGIHIQNTFTGIRYTSGDNISYLNSYTVTDLVVSKKINIKKHAFNFYARVSNVFDSTYYIMSYRPTPGRWFSVGFKSNFTLKE